jgi:glycosyltransferase involved in cell wall biosynthesis
MSPPDFSPRKLRVAVFNRTFSPTGGGAERYSIALVEQLSARHEVHVFAQEIDHQWPGVAYHRVSAPMRKPRWINQLWFATATWWATRRGFDVVHSHENTWHGEVQTVHVMPVKYNLFQGRHGLRRVLRWIKVVTSPRLLAYLALERARYSPSPGRQVVVTSESLRPIMAAAYPDSSAAMSVVTPGITLPSPVAAGRKREARARLGLPAEGRCLLFVGNDYRKKGLAALLQAVAQLPADVVLAVVGNPAHIAEFRALAETLKLGARVFFLGALMDVSPAYEAADILVHPTFEDTFAMVVLEAMAHGLPVVASGPQYCGIAGLLSQGANALLLDDPRDAGELARVLEDLLARAPLRETLSKGALDFAAHYQWREIALQQEALYFAAVTARNASS